MKLILAQPSITRFQWELEVLLTNIRQFTDMEVVLLFTRHDDTVPQRLADKYGARCFVYHDTRESTHYIPSIRPWLLSKYLAGDKAREAETYFYIDADVIFREWPDCATFEFGPGVVVGSDCGGYLDYDYIISRRNGAAIASEMARICGITVEQMQDVDAIGAHLVLTNPTAAFWERAYRDSIKLANYFQFVDSDIQKWTAEMWAQQWGWIREGLKTKGHSELDFAMATDSAKMWDVVKIMHNAGVTAERSHELFFKGQYVDRTPFGEDLSWVRRDKMSHKYVEAIQSVVL